MSAYGGKVIRNLLYHVYPVAGRGVWQWNVAQLLRRMDQFNGQRLVSVVTGPETDTLDAVKKAFQGTIRDFWEAPNDRTLGEVVGFEHLLKRVENIDPRQITYYAHAKGVKYKIGEQPMTRPWAGLMYSHLLDYPSLVEDALQNKTMIGTFKKSGNRFGTLQPSWHYAGTFFWFRNAAIFSMPHWNRIQQAWWGTEAWMGTICDPQHAAHWHEIGPKDFASFHLYNPKVWDEQITPSWNRWQIEHANLRRQQSYGEVLNSLRQLKIHQLLVTGPQRSGTTIAAKILAADLALKYIDEEDGFNTRDLNKFVVLMAKGEPCVIQAPGMAPYAHLVPCPVVWMRRNLQDVLRSQKRVGWAEKYEQEEKDRYFDHSSRPVATIKTEAWERFQRINLNEWAFDLNYETLRGHRLWVDPEERKDFSEKQTVSTRPQAARPHPHPYPCPPHH